MFLRPRSYLSEIPRSAATDDQLRALQEITVEDYLHGRGEDVVGREAPPLDMEGETDEVSPGSIHSLMGLEAARQRVVGRDGLLDHDHKLRGQVGAERAAEPVEDEAAKEELERHELRGVQSLPRPQIEARPIRHAVERIRVTERRRRRREWGEVDFRRRLQRWSVGAGRSCIDSGNAAQVSVGAAIHNAPKGRRVTHGHRAAEFGLG